MANSKKILTIILFLGLILLVIVGCIIHKKPLTPVVCGDGICGSRETAVSCPSNCQTIASSCKKWNPGHYILLTSEEDIDEIELILSNPLNYITGLQIYFTWRQLETEKDVYDFSKIDEMLELVGKYNKHLFVQVSDRTFKIDEKPVPNYLYENPIYNGGVEPFISGKGSVSRIWDPNVNERFNLLILELGKKFDNKENFEGIAFEESALDIDTITAYSYSIEKLVDGVISRIDTAALVFSNSVVIQYMNYGPPEFVNLFEYFYLTGVGMGGPDLVPDEGRFSEKQRIPAYDYYPLYAGKMPLGTAVQTPNLMKDERNEKGIFTLDGFWDMGLNTLKLNYIFWSFAEQPWHKFRFTNDILPYINEREGKINDGCPENRQNK
ncbi:MAG: hypothetical protein KJ646_03390 [Nanoarchaeota archaeon]|nr:hypothetical protein [Nanoarchaeota archaeon]MBU4116911.1 hypothetical protein [Nanoarchaeota archaeon]MBU4580794.1 hypothetical protein [Patescibacteria group bacterium]